MAVANIAALESIFGQTGLPGVARRRVYPKSDQATFKDVYAAARTIRDSCYDAQKPKPFWIVPGWVQIGTCDRDHHTMCRILVTDFS